MYNGLDGELIVGDLVDRMVFNNMICGVMLIVGEFDFCFYVFDDVMYFEMGFNKCYDEVGWCVMVFGWLCVIVLYWEVNILEELVLVEMFVFGEGYEGFMVWDVCLFYKFGCGILRV